MTDPIFSVRVRITQHAAEEYVNDFGGTVEQARGRIGTYIRRASFVSDIIGVDGKFGKLFAYDGICFIVRMDGETPWVITVYKTEPVIPVIRDKVSDLVMREMRRIERREREIERKVAIGKAELAVEIAQFNLRMVKSRSESVKAACRAKISAINAAIAELDTELSEVVSEKRAIAKTVAAYI